MQFSTQGSSLGRFPDVVEMDARDIQRAGAIGPDIRRLIGASLAKGAELDALTKMPAEEREPIIARGEAGEVVTARPAEEREPTAQVARAPP